MTNLLDEGLVEKDALDFEEIRTGRTLTAVIISGQVFCMGGLIVRVNKQLDVRRSSSGYEVRGIDYDYHAWLPATGQPVLRYDMAHEWLGLHVHVFDPATGKELTTRIELDDLPTLDGFIRQALERTKAFVQA